MGSGTLGFNRCYFRIHKVNHDLVSLFSLNIVIFAATIGDVVIEKKAATYLELILSFGKTIITIFFKMLQIQKS